MDVSAQVCECDSALCVDSEGGNHQNLSDVSLCVLGLTGALAQLHRGAARGFIVTLTQLRCGAERQGDWVKRMRFWDEITREVRAVVCELLGTHAFRPKARSPDPATLPYAGWLRQRMPGYKFHLGRYALGWVRYCFCLQAFASKQALTLVLFSLTAAIWRKQKA